MPQTGRAEPHLGSAPDEASGEDELRRRYAFYSQFNAPPRDTGRRFPWRIALLVTATLSGLIASCWLDLTRSDVLPAMRIASGNAISSMTVDADGKVRMRKGIDRAELPNDGIPNEETLAASAVSAASRRAEPKSAEGTEDTAAPATMKVAEADDNASGKGKDKGDDKGGRKGGDRIVAKAEGSAAGKDGVTPAETRIARAEPAKAAAKKSASASKKAKSASRVAAATKPKAKPVHRVARRDPEVERLRQQAEEELKKKTSDSLELAQASSTSPHGLTRDISRLVRARFNSCTRAGNFFEREKCKWEVCGGMWGRNGCPSYRNGVPQ